MEKSLVYAAIGCFIATIISIILNKYEANFFLLLLLPMWGLVLGLSVERVVYANEAEPAEATEEKPAEVVVLYQAKPSKKKR